MIAAFVQRHSLEPSERMRFASLLAFGGQGRPASSLEGRSVMAQLVAPGPRSAWQPGRSASGLRALFNGQLHNLVELAGKLEVEPAGAADIYASAVDRWGDRADHHLVGNYCAIALVEGPGLRLARSPFAAPPLHFRRTDAAIVASSVVRSLFWRDAEAREVDLELLGQRMLVDFSDPLRGWFKGTCRVPLGAVVRVDFRQAQILWRYDTAHCPRIRFRRDEDYVAAARALLDEAVAGALAGSRQPGSLLTGGLDSALVATSALHGIGPSRTLHGFTYGPEAGATGVAPRARYLDECAAVEPLGRLYPNLSLHQFDNGGQDFRHRQRELLRAIDCAPPGLGHAWNLHDIFERGRELGCDVMLCGDFGNAAFSNAAPWGFVEFLLSGRWLQLYRALRHNHGDDRPMWQRFVSQSLIPLLPRPVWRRWARLRHGPREPLLSSGVAPLWAAQSRLVEGARSRGNDLDRRPVVSHRQFWDAVLAEDGQDTAELYQGFEQLYGIPVRDPTAYRPLVEFCHGLPTRIYLHDGTDRWLARQMARGRLPEAQRLNRDHGFHNSDWHRRIARARDGLAEELERMADDPDVARLVDLEGLRGLLERLPEDITYDPRVYVRYVTALNRGVTAGRFVAYAKGRNDI